MRTPVAGAVFQRIPQPPRGVIRRPARVRDLDPQEKPIIRIRQIPSISLTMQRNIMLFGQRQQFL
jgi:hypothetical protein